MEAAAYSDNSVARRSEPAARSGGPDPCLETDDLCRVAVVRLHKLVIEHAPAARGHGAVT